jgi:hypothetical protein
MERESKEKEARRARNLVVNTTVFRSEEVTFGDKNDDSSHDSSNESYNRVSLSLSLSVSLSFVKKLVIAQSHSEITTICIGSPLVK